MRRNGERRIAHALEILRAAGHSVEPRATTGPGTAGPLAAAAIREGADLILGAGGDGAINELLSGMAGSAVPLAVLPAGTANVLANEVGLARALPRAAEGLPALEPRRVALGRLTAAGGARYFLLMAGAGLDGLIVDRLNLRLKKKAGRLAYWTAGFSLLGSRLPEFEVRAGGRLHRCSFALAGRVANYGGDLALARGAHLLQEHFEVVLFEGREASRYVKYLGAALLNRLDGLPGVTVFQARRIELASAAPVPVQVDGEPAGSLPATIEIVPDSLTLLLPPAYAARITPPAPLPHPPSGSRIS